MLGFRLLQNIHKFPLAGKSYSPILRKGKCLLGFLTLSAQVDQEMESSYHAILPKQFIIVVDTLAKQPAINCWQ